MLGLFACTDRSSRAAYLYRPVTSRFSSPDGSTLGLRLLYIRIARPPATSTRPYQTTTTVSRTACIGRVSVRTPSGSSNLPVHFSVPSAKYSQNDGITAMVMNKPIQMPMVARVSATQRSPSSFGRTSDTLASLHGPVGRSSPPSHPNTGPATRTRDVAQVTGGIYGRRAVHKRTLPARRRVPDSPGHPLGVPRTPPFF